MYKRQQLNLKSHPNVFFAGQITGVEGYMESTAMGILAARQIGASLENRVESPPSPDTMMGALIRYITETDSTIFQPMNSNLGLLDPPGKKMNKADQKNGMLNGLCIKLRNMPIKFEIKF